MVAERETGAPTAGNGASPPEPGAPPLIGQDSTVPNAPPVEPTTSVPPPSEPPPWASPETQAPTLVEPATQPQPAQEVIRTEPVAEPEPAPQPPPAPQAESQPEPQPAPQPLPSPAPQPEPQSQPAPQVQPTAALPITPMPPPPGWYGDIFGNPPRWWDGTIWTEHVLVPLPVAEPAVSEDVELNFLDNALISFSLAPDWVKFLSAAVVTAVLALIGLGLISGGSDEGDTPDGFVPQTPELEGQEIPEAPPLPSAPEGAEGTTPR